MGIGSRIFLFTDDNSLERFSLRRYERLLRHDPTERLPQYAGKRLRHALVVLDEIAESIPITDGLTEQDLTTAVDSMREWIAQRSKVLEKARVDS